MSDVNMITDDDLSAYLDGELPPERAAQVEQALTRTPELASRLAGFRADKAGLAALYRPIAAQPVPPAWATRIRAATTASARPARRPAAWAMALAACLVLLLGGVVARQALQPAGDPILALAEQARIHQLPVTQRLLGTNLANAAARDALLTETVGLPVHAPDLRRLGWALHEIDTNAHAATLRYAAADGRDLTLFVRPSAGTPKFDLLRTGRLRTCVWQDEVIGTVMTGDMSAGQMMRVASAAYVALSL